MPNTIEAAKRNERERIAQLLADDHEETGFCPPDCCCMDFEYECFDCIMKFLEPPEEGEET